MNETPKFTREAAEAPSMRKVATKLFGGALFSKAFGFIREIFMAHVVGVAALADSFRSSLTIVLLPLAFLQNESVPAILIPRMQEAVASGKSAQRLAAMTIALTSIGLLLMLITMIAANVLVETMLTGVSSEQKMTTVHFVHLMAFSMPASVALNCLAAGEIALGKTRVANARASVLNLGIVIGLGMLVLTEHEAMLAICFSVSFNSLALWALWALWREGNLSFKHLAVTDVWLELKIFLSRVVPFLPLPVAEQGNIWLERLLASRLTIGAIASMDYARTLTDSAFLLLSQPIGLSVLSHGATDRLDDQAKALTRFVVILMLPASAFIFVFAPDVIRLIFQRGAFNEQGVQLTGAALRGISLGLWASTLGWILLRLLNRAGRSALAAAILVGSYIANMGANAAASAFLGGQAYGTLLLGAGEAVRSLFLCIAVILALNIRLSLFRLIAKGLLPAALMVLTGLEILNLYQGTLERLALGIGAYIICLLLSIALLAPEAYGRSYLYITSRMGAKPDA